MKSVLSSLRIFVFLTLLTGIVYPLIVTGICQLIFPAKANGSLICVNGRVVGSTLIGQSFDSSNIYFTGRPSATGYNPLPSGGSNFSLTSRKLKEQYESRIVNFSSSNGLADRTSIPAEMLFASASGLDPEISPEASILQVSRVCRGRKFSEPQKQKLLDLIGKLTEPPQYQCLGVKRINVLELNIETDKIK